MSKSRIMMTVMAKAMGVHFAVLLFSAAVFGFFCIFVFHAAFSVKGCSIALALASLLWLWAWWRSEEPALRTFVTLLLHSAIVFLFFLGISLFRFMLEHRDLVAIWHIVVLLATAALFWYLRSIAIRRNKETERLANETRSSRI